MKLARLLYAGWAFNLKSLTLSGFFIIVSIISPVIFASIAFLMFRAGARPGSLLFVAIGAGMMGIWSSTLFGAGGAIAFQRWQGTLEYVIGVPPRLIWVILPMTIATASIGLYSLTATLLWGWFVVALPVSVLALGLLGLVLAATFVLYRHANALSNLLEYPIWLVTGLLTGLALLPGWTRPLSWVLAPTWGVKALRESAIGGNPGFAVLMSVLLGLAYLVIGHFCLQYFERLAREKATLTLA
jgi:ABC-2 type transport system permease protein